MENSRHRSKAAVTYKNLVKVFVDNFITATNNPSLPYLTDFSRAILHGVHSIFSPPNVTKHQGQDPKFHRKTITGKGKMCNNETNIRLDY